MKLKADDGAWNPYVAGALVGLLAIVSAYATSELLGKTNYLGASTTFVRAAGLIEHAVAPDHVSANTYFAETKVVVDWQFMLVAGIFIGALISSLSDKSFRLERVPPLWRERFGTSVLLRAAAALAGGAVAMLGARLADGCPSGHGLSGLMQLSLSGIVSLAMFFGTGILCAYCIYTRRVS
jgi:uncharacterized protein